MKPCLFILFLFGAINGFSSSSDAVDFSWSKVTWLRGAGITNENVSGWTENARITRVELNNNGVFIEADTRHWPIYTTSNGGGLQGNFWIIVPKDGRFLAATWEWRRPGQTQKFHRYGLRRMYEHSFPEHIKVSPLNNWRPQGGDVVGFMISHFARFGTGRVPNGRGLPADQVRMRTNIHWYRLPSVDGSIRGEMLGCYSDINGVCESTTNGGNPSNTGNNTDNSSPTTPPTACRPNQREPHYKEVNGQCLPSCGAAKRGFCQARSDKCGGYSLASGRSCSDTNSFHIVPVVPSYQTCCIRKRISTPATPTPEPVPNPTPTTPPGPDPNPAPPSASAPESVHELYEEIERINRELEFLFEQILDIQQQIGTTNVALDPPVSQEDAPICPPGKREPDYREVGNECLPSCSVARDNFCARINAGCEGALLRQDRLCSLGDRFVITPLASYEETCCLIRYRSPLNF